MTLQSMLINQTKLLHLIFKFFNVFQYYISNFNQLERSFSVNQGPPRGGDLFLDPILFFKSLELQAMLTCYSVINIINSGRERVMPVSD